MKELRDSDPAADGAQERSSPPCEPALRELLDEFIESRTAQNTRDAYRIALDGFIRTLRVETLKEFLALQPARVVQFRNRLQKAKRSPSTVNQHLAGCCPAVCQK